MSHAKLSPSGAKRWCRCPAAPTRESNYPDTTSDAAQWGTDAHEILEKALLQKYAPKKTESVDVGGFLS
jgi:hypothetical protein